MPFGRYTYTCGVHGHVASDEGRWPPGRRRFGGRTSNQKYKIFKTNSKDIVIECKKFLGFRDVDELITQRKSSFLAACNANDNSICNVCKHVADRI